MKILTHVPTLEELVQGISLSILSPKDRPWEVHRLQASEVQMLYAISQFPQYSERMRRCAERLTFALRPVEGEEGVFELKLRAGLFCRVRHCPLCQWRGSLRWRARFYEAIPKILRDYPNHRFVFLTLTAKNCPLDELRSTITQMNKAWERLTKRKVWPGVGWIKSVEVTRRPDMMCHPHFHALLMVKPSYFSGTAYLKHEAWAEFWQKSLRIDYSPIVNIKAVKQRSNILGGHDEIMAAITETIKYTVKPEDLILPTTLGGEQAQQAVAWLNGITEQLRNTRSVAIGGVFKNYLSETYVEEEDLIHLTEGDLEPGNDVGQLNFGWRERYGRYELITDEL